MALAWLAGVGWQLQQAELWAQSAYVGTAAVAIAAQGLALTARGAFARFFLIVKLAACVGLGFGIAGWQACTRAAGGLAAGLEGQDLTLTGVVASLPQRGPSGVRFRFQVESATWRGQSVATPALLSMGWYRDAHEDASDASGPRDTLGAGQRWRLPVRLRQPHGSLNPHGFDVELLWFEQGVRALGSVRDGPAEMLEAEAGFPVERLRQRVRDAIERTVSDRRAAGVLAALSVGDQGAIDRDDWDLFRATGIAHLVSISGLHVTMFAWAAGGLIGWAWRTNPRAMLRVPAQHAARWGGVAASAAYTVFSGAGVPSQRTVVMLAVVALLQTMGRRWPWPLVLLAAAVVVTAMDPWAMLQPGFWLSFMAVGLLMASGPPDEGDHSTRDTGGAARPDSPTPNRPSRLIRLTNAVMGSAREGLRSQVIATIGLAPLTIVFFQQISLVGFAANIVAIPLVTLLITPLALLGAFVPELWPIAALLVQALCAYLAWLAQWPVALWVVPAAPLWAQLAGLLAAVLLALPIPWRIKLLALPLSVPLWLPPTPRPTEGAFELLAADIGQGTAVLVRTRSHTLLFDTGPQYLREANAGVRVLVPLLAALGERRLDALVLSHRDSDHVGGATAVLAAVPVAQLRSSLAADHPLLSQASSAGTREVGRCQAGQGWTWDGVRFELLQPPVETYSRNVKPNALSCVLRVAGARGSALITADIERDQEVALVASQARALRVDVLMAPHHGSKTSSSAEFLDAVAPQLAVIQAGYRNRYGHPAQDVLARYTARGISLVDSSHCGAWRWQSDTPPSDGRCERAVNARYWHHRAAPAGESILVAPTTP